VKERETDENKRGYKERRQKRKVTVNERRQVSGNRGRKHIKETVISNRNKEMKNEMSSKRNKEKRKRREKNKRKGIVRES
jgi:hypothetical protein